jgi:hypothetical protein
LLFFLLLISFQTAHSWGFFAHGKINYYAVFSLPPELLHFYKQHLDYLKEHATDPDKRRYSVAEEGPRHYIDIDRYGKYPYLLLPRDWDEAVCVYSEDTLRRYGIVPWHIQLMQRRLTFAFIKKDMVSILRLSAELGHYIADAHVPLHASSNHNGQLTGQHGIHGFWESRIPELLAEKTFSFWVGKATYIADPADYIWQRVLESARAADTVLIVERLLNAETPVNQKYAFEKRNNVWLKQYSSGYTKAYNTLLHGMVERRMQLSIHSLASFWYTAWIDAGQPDLEGLKGYETENDRKEWNLLNRLWRKGGQIRGRSCE